MKTKKINTLYGLTKKENELKRKFNIEKDAKNEAYHFILEYGLLKAFSYFCKLHRGEEHHKECLKILVGMAEKSLMVDA